MIWKSMLPPSSGFILDSQSSRRHHYPPSLEGVIGTPDITKEITKGSEIKCQCCVGLKSELNNIATELKNAMEIIEILKKI
jgi:hypothetical protein